MIDEVKVRARKSAKHGKIYEYRFETAPIGGERKWYSKGGLPSGHPTLAMLISRPLLPGASEEVIFSGEYL